MSGRALVIGASGLVGGYLVEAGRARGWDVTGTHHGFPRDGSIALDIADASAIARAIAEARPDVVLLPAARADVEACEADPAATRVVNADGPRAVAAAAREQGARLVFYSTDYVFDGEDGPYDEDAPLHPISVYGRQKAEAERAVLDETRGEALVLRTTVVYGREPQGKNFVARLVRELTAGNTLRAPVDQLGSPTYAADLASATWELLDAGASGVVHVCGPEVMSRTDFARLAARVFALDESLVLPVTTAELAQRAARPLRAGMTTARLERIVGHPLRTPEAGLHALRAEMAAATGGAA